jgi:signal transduction histidine kinase
MEEANRAKAEFLATISHELRTPLNAIVGYADLLGMGVVNSDPERGKEYVGRIGIAARHLAELIEEVLAFSRLESGREVVSSIRVSLGDLLDEIRVIAEPLAEDKKIQLDVHAPEEPIEVVTDARKLRQILLNIVGNAIKFTAEGGVTVESALEGEFFVLRVSDTGIGIDQDHIDRIFEPFWQVEQGTTRNVGGTGLGLTVTKRFVDLLGGSMQVDSEPGKGTTISIRLPIRSD